MARKSRAEGTEEVGQDFARLLGERQDEMAERLSKHTAGAEELRPEVERACEAFQRSFVEDPDCYADFWVAAGQEQLRQGYSIKDIQDGMSISHRVISELIAEAHADDLKTMLTLTRLADDILDRARVKLGEVCATTYQGIIAEREQAEEKPRKGREHLTERKQAEEELEQKIKQLTDLNRLSQTVTASLEMERVLDEVVSLIHEAIDSDCTAVVMVDERGNLTLGSEAGLDVMELLGRIRSEGYTSWIFHTRQAVIMDDVAEDGTVTSQTPAEAPIILNPHLLKAGVKSLAGLPLIVKDRMLGVLFLHSLKPYHFHGQLPLLSTFANQAAIAIENARLVEEARQRARRLQTAAEVSRAASSVLDPNELIQQAVDLIHEEFNLYYVGLFLVDETGAWTDEPGRWAVLRAGTGEAGRKMLEQGHKLEVGGESMIGWCVANAQARIALDVGEEAVRFEHPLLPDTHSEMALPLISRGQVIGAVSVQSSEPAAFSDEDVTTLQTMTDQLANAIKNAHLYAEIRRRLDELTILDRVSRALTSTLDLQETLTLIVERTIELLGVAATSVSVYDEEEGDLWFVAASGAGADTILGRRLEMGQGIAGWVAQHGEPVIVPDVTQDARFSGDFDRESGFTTRSIMCVPLQSKGQTIGSIEAMNKESGPFDQQDVQLLASLAATAAIAIENARLFASIEAQVEERTRQVAIFQALVENATDAVAMGDLGGLVTYGNRAFYELFGYDYKSQELIGLPMTSFLPEEDHQLLAEEVMPQAMSGGWSGERRGQRKDGSLSEIRLTVFPVLDEAGQPVSLAAMIRDISERKRLEQQVRESLERRTYQVQTSTDVAQDIAAAPALDELFRRVVALVKERFGYYHAQVFRSDPQTGDLIMAEGYGEAGRAMKEAGHRIEFGKGVVGTAAASKLPVLVPDVSESPDWLPNPHLPETQGELAVPIMLRDRVLGVLDVQSEQAGLLSEEDQILLLGLCGQIASAIESTRLLEEVSIFRQFAEASGQGFAMGTLEGIITYVNPTICRLIEEDRPEDTYGKSIAVYYPEEMQQRLQNEILPAVMQEGQWVGELAILSTKGKITPTIENIFLIRDEQGNPLYLADVMTDIGERKQAEEELRRSETMLRSIIDASPDWVFVKDRDFRYHLVNESFASGLGVKPEDFAGKDDYEMGFPAHLIEGDPEQDIIGFRTDDRAVLERGETLHNPYDPATKASGEIAIFDTYKIPLRDAEGNVWAVLGLARDITEQKRAAEELERRVRQLTGLSRASQAVTASLELNQVLDEIISLARDVTASDYTTVVMMDEKGKLIPGAEILPGVPDMEKRIRAEGYTSWIFRTHQAVILDDVDENGTAISQEPAGAPLALNPHLFKIGIKSLAGLPLIVKDRVLGVLFLHSHNPYHFHGQFPLLNTFANQVAIAIENARLFEEAREHAGQLQTAAEVSRAASSILDPDELLRQTAELIRERFDLYYAGIFLVDEQGEYAVLRAGTGKAGRKMLEQGHKLEVGGESMIGWCVANAQARIALDVGEEAVRFENPLLPDTHSEMALPLISRGQVLGAITVQSSEPAAFSEEDITALQTMADQLANAIQNAWLFGRTQAALQEVTAVHRQYIREEWRKYMATQTVEERTGYLYDAAEGASAGRVRTPQIEQAVEQGSTVALAHLGDGHEDTEAARAQAALVAPIILRGQPIGVLGFEETEGARGWTEEEIALVEGVANQLALAIENARLFEETQETLEETGTLYEATSRISGAAAIEEVLDILGEQIQDVLAGEFSGALYLAGPDPSKRAEWVEIRVRWDEPGRSTQTAIPVGLRLPVEQFPLLHVSPDSHQPILIPDVLTDDRMDEAARQLALAAGARGAAAIPLATPERWLGFIGINCSEARVPDERQVRLLSALADRAAVAIENRLLLEETQDLAYQEQLVNEITARVLSSTDMATVLQTAVQELNKVIGSSRAYIQLGTEDQ